MPTITIQKRDLEQLLGQDMTQELVESYLPWVKGEWKGYDPVTGDLRIELSDSNRPDLWCVEGIARQIRGRLQGHWPDYDFFYPGEASAEGEILVAPEMSGIRPYVGGFSALGLRVDAAMLAQVIQTQEKISEIFGQSRRRLSIGIYDRQKITFPVYYRAVDPETIRFTPLGMENPLSLSEILQQHPKGQAYAKILSGHKQYPILIDDAHRVLSFPPIVNSREVGEVQVGDRDLFVEVTGMDLRLVLLVLNVFAVNLADRGGAIRSTDVVYPYPTEFGNRISLPKDLGLPIPVSMTAISKALGVNLGVEEVASVLDRYGYWVKKQPSGVEVTCPPYRDDVMHPVDVIEDVAVSRGFDTFDPVLPSAMTVGELSPLETFSDRIRALFVGMGFQEVISNILTSREDMLRKMRTPEERVVEVDNVMSESYSVLRPWILPSLLGVEAASGKSFYPHRIFEVGEAAVYAPEHPMGNRTLLKAGALVSHAGASFSEIHSFLDLLMYYLSIPYRLEPVEHPSFIAGRFGTILVKGQAVGRIGEVHPEVLEFWEIHVPCSAVELVLDDLLKGNS